jgi:hypothetical protein
MLTDNIDHNDIVHAPALENVRARAKAVPLFDGKEYFSSLRVSTCIDNEWKEHTETPKHAEGPQSPQRDTSMLGNERR